eukprot:8640610-Lingulodinium_polyedra.AAC.1
MRGRNVAGHGAQLRRRAERPRARTPPRTRGCHRRSPGGCDRCPRWRNAWSSSVRAPPPRRRRDS